MPASRKKRSRAGIITFGGYINSLRVDNGMTMRQLSKATGIGISSLCRLEAGAHVPSVQRNIEAIDKLWVVLGGDMNQMLYLSTRCPLCSGTGAMPRRSTT